MICPRCGGKKFWHLATGQRRCAACGLTRKFERTYWSSTKMSPYWKGRLIEYFCLGLPAYRLRFQVPLDLKTVQRWFRILRLAIYAHEQRLTEALVSRNPSFESGRIALSPDFRVSAGHVALGIYKENGNVFTLPLAVPAAESAAAGGPSSLHPCGETLAYAFLELRGNSIVVNEETASRNLSDLPDDIGGFWAFARSWLKHYRGVPRDYFPLYLKEIEWRFNHRNENLTRLIRNLLDQKIAPAVPGSRGPRREN